jgi:homoserine kinase
MGETVEAIGYKTDVKSRVKENIAEKKDAVVSRVTGAMPDGEQLKSGARKVGVSKQNPLGLGLAAVAAGFVVGTLLPSTNVEDERLGEMSDQVGDKAREAGQEALERGKDVAREAADGSAEQLASSLRDKAQEVGSS